MGVQCMRCVTLVPLALLDFCFLPSPSVDDIYCTSLIRHHGYYFFRCSLLCSYYVFKGGYYSRVAFISFISFLSLISFRASVVRLLFKGCNHSRAVTIRERQLAQSIHFSSLWKSSNLVLSGKRAPKQPLCSLFKSSWHMLPYMVHATYIWRQCIQPRVPKRGKEVEEVWGT